MQLKVWVQQVRTNKWKDREKNERTDHMLVCMDADESGEVVPAALEYELTPEEQTALSGQKVAGKMATIAVNSIRPVGSTLKLRGRLLSVGGLAEPKVSKAP